MRHHKTILNVPTSATARGHQLFNNIMADELAPNRLGSIRLSYEQPLPDEHLKGIEDMIRQAGLQIQNFRRFTAQRLDRTDHMVEIIANYDDMASDDWSDLIESIVQTYCWSAVVCGNSYNMRKRISASDLREVCRQGNIYQRSMI